MLKNLLAAGALLLGAALPLGVAEAAWPKDRPIEIIVAFAPGGSTDIMARAIQPHLERILDAKIVIVNRPGASGEIAYTALAQAKPDGYTLGFIGMPGFLTMQIERKLRFDPKDIKAVARLADDPTIFVVRSDSPHKSLTDVVAAAKEKPKAISIGSTGVGTDEHLAIMLLEQKGGVQLTHVPFTGGAEIKTALLGGHIPVGGLNMSDLFQFGADSARVRAIAQFAESRWEPIKDVPTAREQGYDIVMASERVLASHRAVPDDIRKRLAEAVDKLLQDPEFQARAKELNLPLAYVPGEQWEEHMAKRLEGLKEIWAKTPWVQQ